MQINFESVPYRPDESIACFEFNGPKIVCPYHQHPEYEIAWIKRSDGQFLVGDSVGSFGSGDLFLLGANLPHIFWNHENSAEAQTLVIQFQRDAFGEKLFDAPEMREIARVLAASSRGLRWNLGKHSPPRALLRDLPGQQGTGRVIRFLELLQMLSRIPPDSELSSIAYGHTLNGLDSSRMQAVTAYVQAHIHETICQSNTAKQVGMSAPSFRRFFQRTTHRTFPRFVNELRISETCRLLVTTDLTVTEILFRCGYRNQANFYRRFRQILGTTPESYRKRLQVL